MHARTSSFLSRFPDFYAVWVLGLAAVGLCRPEWLSWFNGDWVKGALTLVMLSMGFTLTMDDFRRILKMPGAMAIGFLAHYTIMPLSGWLVGELLRLDPQFKVGLVLVASCPSGTASNVICFLARANVALAVTVTLTSTLFAFIMTPLWCKLLAGKIIPFDALSLCLYTLQIAVLPVLIGVACNAFFPRTTARVSHFGPPVSVVALMFITGGIVARNAPAVIAHAGHLLLAAVLLHVIGFVAGYLVARLLRYPEELARTISIEVGMQNGGLAATLAGQTFRAQPLVAVPAVFSSVTQSLFGGLLATWWRNRPVPAPAHLSPARESAEPATYDS